LNVQACASLETFAEEIVDPVASRVFARSTFEYGHDPEPAVLEADAFVATVLQAGLACAVPFPPQDASTNPAATSRTALSAMRPIVRRGAIDLQQDA
jgi:hypothetical protein